MFVVKQATQISDVPTAVISLLNQAFPYIHDVPSAEAYFFKRGGDTTVFWLEFEGQVIAHYALMSMDFMYQGQRYRAGKPELNVVDKNFIKTCLKRKLVYATLDPLGVLNKALYDFAVKKGYAFLFTWPNDISIPFYRRQGYTEEIIPLSLYVKFFKVFVPQLTLISIADFDSLDIVPSVEPFVPVKTVALLNQRFQDARFERYRVLRDKKGIGYIVVKNEDGIQKIVDYGLAKENIPVAFAVLKRTAQRGILYRQYGQRLHFLSALCAGFIPYKRLSRTLMYKKLQDIPVEKIQWSDFCSDYSM